MSKANELKAAHEAALREREAITKERIEEESKELSAFRADLQTRMEAKYRFNTNVAWEKVEATRKVMVEELDRIARMGGEGKFAVGTKVAHEKSLGSGYYYGRSKVMEYGLIECVTTDSVFPEPRSRRGNKNPQVGTFIIRLIKKNGSTGLLYEMLAHDGDLPHGWAVVGGVRA